VAGEVVGELNQHLSKISKEGLVILHCVDGSRASVDYTLLAKKGYKNVKYLNDSFTKIAKKNAIELM
jgi:hydroxyacylglutathione hydrolase